MNPRYHIVLVVWGETFTQLYVDLALPTILSPGNLPALAARADVSYHIHATRASEAMIRSCAAFPALAASVGAANVEFHRIDDQLVRDRNKYALLSSCHRRSLQIARERDEALIFLGPDGIFADGCLRRIHELALAGFRAVMIVGVRAQKSGFIGDLRREFELGSDHVITLPPRKLVELLTHNLHPVERALCWREEELASWPSHLLWPVGRSGLLARCYHLHPLMIRPQCWTWQGDALDTVDGDMTSQAVPERDKIHIVTDSDEIVACELSDEIEAAVHRATANLDSGTRRVAAWMRRATGPLQRDFVRRKIRFHAGGSEAAEGASWHAAETGSDEVIARIQRDYALLENSTG